MIIDTHVHIWHLKNSAYDWLKSAPEILQKNYNLSDIEEERKKTSVSAGLLVQADNTLADTALMINAAAEFNWIKGVVGWLPLMNPSETNELLQSLVAEELYFKGVRHLIHDEPNDNWLLQAPVLESLKLLSKNHLPYDVVGVKPTHIETALKVAHKIPELNMVFDHLNQPPIQTGEKFGRWGALMKEAAGHHSFYAKISGLSTVAGNEKFTVEQIKPYIDFILTHFGEDRCFVGGDWPVSLLGGASYSNIWNVYIRAIDSLISDERIKQKIFTNNAIQFYHLDI